MQGLHLTADLHQCRCAMTRFTDASALASACLDAVNECGLRAVDQLFHAFPETRGSLSGVTATVLLAESHLCVHTWPEQRAATLDVYVCNYGADHSAKAHALLDALAALFEPGHVERHELRRGRLDPPLPPLGEGRDGGRRDGTPPPQPSPSRGGRTGPP